MKFIDYSLKNSVVTHFLVIVLVVGGLFSYIKLGKLEDPSFTIKEALVVTLYPGADAHRVELQVTDKVEEALQKVPNIEYLESVSKDGISQVKIKLNEDTPSEEIDQYWDIVRKKLVDMELFLPKGVVPPIVLDDYGAVYGIFLGISGEDYSYKELDKYARYIQKEMNSIKGISKSELYGTKQEAFYLELDRERLSALKINPKLLSMTLVAQNLASSGADVDFGNSKINLSLNSQVDSLKEVEDLVVFSGRVLGEDNQVIKVKDIATVKKGYVEPYMTKMYLNGKKTVGLSLAPENGTNVLITGKRIDKKIKELEERLPTGITINKIYYQPDLVDKAINNFILNLVLSVGTVILVLLISMGMKSGFVIGSGLVFSILGTLIFMIPMDISLQRVSLGSFIIAMGMLVDNSIVIVDGFLVAKENKESVDGSLLRISHKNALPLLGGTLIASIAFLPGSIMPTYAGEYTKSAFWVISISLMLSWILAITQIPVYCKKFLSDIKVKEPGRIEKKIYSFSRGTLDKLLANQKKSLFVVALAFGISMVGFVTIPKTFFPDSDKKMFRINVWVPEGNKIQVAEEKVKRIEEFLKDKDEVEEIALAIGGSPSRYYVATIPQMPDATFGQLIVKVKKLKDIGYLDKEVSRFVKEKMPDVMVSSKKYPNGVATEYPIEAEFRGPDPKVLRELANKTVDIMRKNDDIVSLKINWREKVLAWEGDFSEVKGKRVGITPLDTILALRVGADGMPIGRVQENDRMIPIILRNNSNKKKLDLQNLGQTPIWGALNNSEPLSSVLDGEKLIYKNKNIWRRNRTRSIKVQASIPTSLKANEVLVQVKKAVEEIEIPNGYVFEWRGERYEEIKNQKAIASSVPLVSLIMFSICVLLFADVLTPILIFAMLPLALIGIVPGLMLTGKSFGFMSIIGVIALSGIMIKNIIVLMDEINFQIKELKVEPRKAVKESAISRIRAVSLAAGTTIFGMLPLLRDPLYGDMSATIIFGLLASTILTLFIFPVLYSFTHKI